MRVSIREQDEGYAVYRAAMDAGHGVRVTLLGDEVRGVIVADSAQSFILRYALDENGDHIPERDTPERPMLIREGGEVKIEIGNVQNSMHELGD